MHPDWRELLRSWEPWLTERESQELARNERLLRTIRARLHLLAGRGLSWPPG